MKCFLYIAGVAALAGASGRAESPDYLSQVKPLLASRCFDCHGSLKQKAKLRVDTVAAMLDADMIIPGEPESSELIYRIQTHDPDERMPPEHEGVLFTEAEVKVISDWVAAGAIGPEDEEPEAAPEDHWAFQRIERPKVPSGSYANPIDAFLAEKHQEHGLQTVGLVADPLLIRRAHLALTGLPPTPKELMREDFDYPALVDELLASPHYGERWGRHWMDVWRYSDWYGLDDQLRISQKHIWRWRDWIVGSLNADKSYAQMIAEMLAGDEIDPTDPDVLAATGFLARNYYLFNRTTWLDNTIEHTGKAFLGLTFNCAKCHDHKYDPITQVDYYNFRAFFEPHHIRLDAVPGETDFDRDGLPRAYDDFLDVTTQLHLRGNPATPDESREISPLVPAIFESFGRAPEPIDLPVAAWAPGTRDFVQRDLLAAAESRVASLRERLSATPSPSDTRVEDAGTWQDDFSTARPELWTIHGSGWRYQGGDLVQLEATDVGQRVASVQSHPHDLDLELSFRITGGPKFCSAGIRFDVSDDGQDAVIVYASCHAPQPKVQLAYATGGKFTYPSQAKKLRPVSLDTDYTLGVRVRGDLVNVSLDGEHQFAWRLAERKTGGKIDLFAYDATAEFSGIRVEALPGDRDLVSASNTPNKLVADRSLLAAKVEAAELSLSALRARIAADSLSFLAESDAAQIDAAAQQAALLENRAAIAAAEVDILSGDTKKQSAAKKQKERASQAIASQSREYSHVRGSRKALETPVHKVEHYAATYPKTSTGRRSALVAWIVSRDNPLTARVAANHIWMRHFGEPLVANVFDFGRQTTEPEHLALLDYLAVELIDSGWSMKHLHQLMLTSLAWQRSASNLGSAPENMTIDKENRYYWRMNSRRLEAQVVRDSLLSLAGVLDLTMGGPSVSPSPESRRRSLYFLHSRDQQSKFLAAFDDADILSCYRRSASIVPQQALALSNGKVAIDSSEQIAASGPQEDSDFVTQKYIEILCRPPSQSEREACLEFLAHTPSRARLVQALLNHNDFLMIR